MKKIIFFSDWKQMYNHPTPQCEPFIEVPFAERDKHIDPDAYVQINIQHSKHVKEPFREPFYNYIAQSRKPKIVFESAVFRQNVDDDFYKKYFRFAWNSFLWNEANFGPLGNGPDRWNRIQQEHDIEIKPWREKRGEYILVVLQHVIDTSLIRMMESYGSYYNWFYNCLFQIRTHTDLPIVIRPHPKHGMYSNFFDADRIPEAMERFPDVYWSRNQGRDGLNGGKYLQKDLDDAHAVVGWTSNALTEAACYGIPVYPMSAGSMATPIAERPIHDIDNMHRMPDRQQWLNDLAYCQWTYDEIHDGTAWNHIKNANIS
jgi:hypothetical protein